MPQWESVTPSRDQRFYGWSYDIGQTLIGKVVSTATTPEGYPEIVLEVTEPTRSFAEKKNEWTDIAVGHRVVLTCRLSNLRKGILRADPKAGDMLRIELESLFETPKGQSKIFDIKIARTEQAPSTLQAKAPF